MTAPTVTPAEVTIARPVIAGTWSELAASSLKVEIGGAAYVLGANAEIASDGIGNWSLTLPAALVDGTYDVVVTTADAAGTSLADATQNEIVIDAQGPAAPGVALYSGEQGPRQVTGTWDRQNAATLSVAIPAINLRETLGTGTALTSEAGEWTLLLQSELAPGSYDVAVETTDSKGRVARDQTRFEILVKGAPPPPPPPPPPEMKRPAITPYGGAETPAAIVGTWDEGVAKSLVVSIKGTSISASLGIEPRLTSDGGGNWALALSEKLPPGTYDVVAETLDEAGNHAMDGSMGELVITEPPPPPPPPPYDCEGVFAAVAAAHPVRFAFDSWVITPADAEMVSKAAAVLADPRCLDRKAEVTGHADYFGGKLYNRALSIRRAQVVVDALVKGGVEPNRLSVTGLGEQSPDVPDRTRDARGKNRRVILTIVK
jgi:outer membrane protein OmpA-like peptidoglycan-associated protein